MAGGIARQPQDGWSADAPVGDEQRSVGTQLRARYADRDAVDDSAHQTMQHGIVDTQREERGDGSRYLMAGISQPLQPLKAW